MATNSTLYRYQKKPRKEKDKNGSPNLKRGRPSKLKPEDEELVFNLAKIYCSTQEIGAVLDVSRETIEKNYSKVIERGREIGKTSLRKAQFKAALEGNITMQIWLGKILLHQTPPKDGIVVEEDDVNSLMDFNRSPLNQS